MIVRAIEDSTALDIGAARGRGVLNPSTQDMEDADKGYLYGKGRKKQDEKASKFS